MESGFEKTGAKKREAGDQSRFEKVPVTEGAGEVITDYRFETVLIRG